MAEKNNIQERSFLGRGWSFPPTFSKINNEVVMIADEMDIQKSIETLLSTTIGERFLQPGYGCNLENYVFEPMNATIQTLIKLTVKNALIIYETRIKLLSVKMDSTTFINEGRADINIDYEIIGTNSRFNLVYPFYLNEANDKTA
jgi:phage baseplate assembly protein W